MAKPMKRKDFVRMIEQAGWTFDPASKRAGHDQWVKGSKKFAVPRHTTISPYVVKMWFIANQD